MKTIAEYYDELCSYALELLKERGMAEEAVPSIVHRQNGSEYIYCGSCNKLIGSVSEDISLYDLKHDIKFCIFCGKKINWNA